MKLTLSPLLLILLLSCSTKEQDYEVVFKKVVCQKSISYNEELVASVKALFEEAGRPPDELRAVADCERIASWRRVFMRSRTRENLLLYSDSVSARYFHLRGINGEYLNPIKELKNRVHNTTDTLSFYNLLYFTSVAEGELLKENATRMGVVCGPSFTMPTFLSKEEYRENEPVYLTFNASEKYFSNTSFDFSDLVCKRIEGGGKLEPEVVKSGPHYILIYHPETTGNYKIHGNLIIKQEGNFTSSLMIENWFRVKNSAPNKS